MCVVPSALQFSDLVHFFTFFCAFVKCEVSYVFCRRLEEGLHNNVSKLLNCMEL